MAAIMELLHPQVIFDTITNRIKVPNDVLQRFFGMTMGGANTRRIRGRTGVYDIFDRAREVGNASMPNTPATRINAFPIAQQPCHLLRKHEAIPMYYDQLNNMRQLGKPSSIVDAGGAMYVREQETRLKDQFSAFREFLCASFIRGTVYFNASGDLLTPTFTSGSNTISISQQIPANNQNQLNGIIATSWDNTAAAKIFDNVLSVNQQSITDTGYPVKHIWVNSTVWSYVLNNSQLRALAGSANITFENWAGLGQANVPGEKQPDEMTAMVKPLPGITWHIYDGAVALNGTVTRLISDTGATFTPEPNREWCEMIEGTEMIVEAENQPAVERELPYFWPWYYRDPARVEIVGMDLVMPALRIPKSIYAATVKF